MLPGISEPDWGQWQGPSDFGTVDPRVDINNETVKVGMDEEKKVDSGRGGDA